MRANTSSQNAMPDYTTLYMSFEAEPGYQDDVMESVLSYALKATSTGQEYMKKHLIACKSASGCSIYWEYEPALKGDWCCKFCCGAQGSSIVVNGFVNSRPDEDTGAEIFYVRLAICPGAKSPRQDLFMSRSGVLKTSAQASSFDSTWIKMSETYCGRKIA